MELAREEKRGSRGEKGKKKILALSRRNMVYEKGGGEKEKGRLPRLGPAFLDAQKGRHRKAPSSGRRLLYLCEKGWNYHGRGKRSRLHRRKHKARARKRKKKVREDTLTR